MDRLNKTLQNGEIPNELNFTSSKDAYVLDWDKIKYNTFYKTPEYFDKRFNPCLKNLPGYDKILNLIVEANEDNSLTKEMVKRKNMLAEDIEFEK